MRDVRGCEREWMSGDGDEDEDVKGWRMSGDVRVRMARDGGCLGM